MKTHAIRINDYGGPEVLQWELQELPEPGPGEARIRHTAIGVNFVDVYHRSGLYPTRLPAGLGSEAAGVVEATGDDVEDIAVGDRVVYTGRPNGAYAERRNFSAAELVPLPAEISDEVAAAVFLKGLTAWYLLHHSYRVAKGDWVLWYAAAGGVGSIATQWARHLGARVIGVVSTGAKAELALSQGCEQVIMADEPDIPAAVRKLAGGQGVAAVYDSVGNDTFMKSLDCLRPHGTMVSFGNASGAVEPFTPAELAKRGSLYVTRPTLADFIASREALLDASAALFDFLATEGVSVRIGQTYRLRDAARAHRELEARQTTGSSLLLP